MQRIVGNLNAWTPRQ